jgi:hypothetical protein
MARAQKVKTGTVEVTGLPELSKALKAIGPDAQRELREASKKVASFVADDARSAAQSLGGVAAKTAPSIKATGGVAGAGVAMGGPSFPFAGGAAWGASKYPQFKEWRGHIGYFPYPQIVQDADKIETEFTAAIDNIIKRRFPQ